MIVKTTRAHYEEYRSLFLKIGITKIYPYIPETNRDVLLEKLAEDKHLNNIPLVMWDRVREGHSYNPSNVDVYNRHPLMPTIRKTGHHASSCDVVCLLKHVAIFELAGAIPEFED
jgi:hypothetical protein